MLADPKAKVARRAKVLLLKLILLNLEAPFEDFFGFGTSNRDVYCDFFVTADTKGTDGVARFACLEGMVRRKGCEQK